MLFNSYEFFVFFPIVTIIFFLLPHRYRWLHLLLASCIFYMYFVPVYILILFFTILVDYVAGIKIESAQGKKRKFFLILSLIANIGVLAIFKYYNFFIENINSVAIVDLPFLKILLPIGLSFHTFQAMSYTVEIYRGKYKAERHFGIYALYVMFYPQLVAGPIERPQNVLPQFHQKQVFDYKNAVLGLRLIVWGLIKKMVIADHLALFTDPIFNAPQNYPGITLAIATAFFAFQIFCDFSGYSDIALGTARVMGFKLMTNFNKPYHAKSISEFWKRWHISLSTWFRDYLYIPLGGNRVALPRVYFNLFFVFLVSGFWHGANWTFIIWGALHGFYLIFAQATEKIRKSIFCSFKTSEFKAVNDFTSRILVFALVCFAWIFFRANNLPDAVLIVEKIAHFPNELLVLVENENFSFLNFPKELFIFGLISILALELAHLIDIRARFSEKFETFHPAFRWSVYLTSILLILFLGLFQSKSFIYFQF